MADLKKWEHLMIPIGPDWESKAQELGGEGWEMVAVLPGTGSQRAGFIMYPKAFFKRPAQPKPLHT